MLHKISFGLLRPERGEQPHRPLFARRGTEPPRPPSPLDFSDGPLPTQAERRASYAVSTEPLRYRASIAPTPPTRSTSYLNSRMEALALEPLIAPSLAPVDHFARNVNQGADLQRGAPPPRPQRSMARAETDFAITPIPRRPTMARRAHSDRGRAQLPLRVQAVRRLHQAAMARALAVHMEEIAQSRRTSEEDDYGHTSPLEPVELRAWEQRGAELVRWDELSQLPDVTSPIEEPQQDLFAEAFSRVSFGSYDMAAPDSGETTPRAGHDSPAPDDDDPFEFDRDSAYDSEYESRHTPPLQIARRRAGNYI